MISLAVVGSINQLKSVSMMSLTVVGSIDQSNSGGFHGSLWVVSMGLCGWSPWVPCGWSLQVSAGLAGGLHGWSLWVVVGRINQSKSVPMMSLTEVGSIDQSNSGGLCRSLQVVSAGLHGWSLWVVSKGGLHGWSLWVSMGGLHGCSLWVSGSLKICTNDVIGCGGVH